MSNMRRHSRVHAHPAQSAASKAGAAEDDWQGSDDESTNGSVSAAESSVGGSPRMRMVSGGSGTGMRRSSPLARMHPYAHAQGRESPSDERGGNGLGQSAALYRLPLVPHYAAE